MKDIKFRLASGQEVLLSSHKGRVIALEFLLTGCPHCQQTSRAMERLYQQYGKRGFQPIGIAINPDADLNTYVKGLNLTFPVGKGSQEAATEFLQHPIMSRMLMPQLVIIDREGVIRGQWAGSDPFLAEKDEEKNLRAEILKLLGGSGGTKKKKKAPARNRPS
jgi:peroxiredoxin